MNRAVPEVSPHSSETQTAEHVGLPGAHVAHFLENPGEKPSWPELYGYRITDEIAAGGMAVIYRAVQESLQRPVAIKALRSDVLDEMAENTNVFGRPNWRDRFKREARILALLKHPNLVEIYDLLAGPGQTLFDDGPLFIVMELCEGIDLLDVLTATPVLPPDVAAYVALGAAQGLSHIHAREILHRDVKPANLLLTRHGEIKLIDFGTAWDPMNPRDLRGEERGLGTPSYMSPEQARGEPLDFRSDQFALGAVLYQMLAGRKPFVARSGARPVDDPRCILEQVVHNEPPPLATQNRAAPRRLVRIVERCLKKRPGERYPSTDELCAELARCVGRDPGERLLQFLVDGNLLKTGAKSAPRRRNPLKALLRL
jgi:eukaryotic-like serine/threonine-protein kinase